MIRLASISVFLIGALVAFGAFYVARGGSDSAQPVSDLQVAEESVAADAPAAPQEGDGTDESASPENTGATFGKLHYLNAIDFDKGEITLVLHQGTGAPLIIRDQTALRAAQSTAYLSYPEGQETWGLTDVAGGANVIEVFRGDRFIAAITCLAPPCDTPQGDHAGLTDVATPYQLVEDQFSDHAAYLETIAAIETDPNFMLLDQRDPAGFPAPAIMPSLTIALPTAVLSAQAAFDPAAHEALLSAAITPHLPEGAEVSDIQMTALFPAFVADKDNGEFVTAAGQPIAFPAARFLPVSVEITGTDRLSARAI